MLKWIKKSLGRKVLLFTIIVVVIVTIILLQTSFYASKTAFIEANEYRNYCDAKNIMKSIDRELLVDLCKKAEKFYTSHDDLYMEYKQNEKLIQEEFNTAVHTPKYDELDKILSELILAEGPDEGRLVLVDYSNSTYFTFFVNDPESEPGERLLFYRKPESLERKPIETVTENPLADTEVLKQNRVLNIDLVSMTYLIYEAEDHPFRIYLFLDTEEELSGLIGGFAIKDALLVMALSMILLGLIVLMLVRHAVIYPLNNLSEATGSLINNLVNERENGYVYKKIDINTGDEIEHLYHCFQIMEEDIYDYMDRLKIATSQKERISTELYIAESIQKQMLPSVKPDFSNQPCFDLAASMHPAKEVGGDFYDFFMLSEDRLAFLIADVSGKGIPAALVMAIGKTVLKNYLKENGDVSETFRIVNNVLLDANENSMFITAFGAILNLRTGNLTYVNAGHEDPFVMSEDGVFVLRKEKHSVVLGAVDGITYNTHSMKLIPGDRIYIYTDGVIEAQNHEQVMFGYERTGAVLNEVKNVSVSELIKSVRKSVNLFVGDEPQFDDMTMMCLDFKAYYTD